MLLNDVGTDTFWTHFCSRCPKCVQRSVQTKLFGHLLAKSVQFMSKMCPTELLVSKKCPYFKLIWTYFGHFVPKSVQSKTLVSIICPKSWTHYGHLKLNLHSKKMCPKIKNMSKLVSKMCPNYGHILDTFIIQLQFSSGTTILKEYFSTLHIGYMAIG